jgi:clan AA aspartic protease
MGLTSIRVTIINPAHERKQTALDFLVDSGAIYSVVPKEILKKLAIRPRSKKEFTLANGERIERTMGDAIFAYSGERGASPVIFGEKGDSTLLGAVTLEALGLMLDPLRREIRSLPMVLG